MPSGNGCSTVHKTIDTSRWALVAAVILTAIPSAWAEAYISLRAGLPCSSCHVNQTGGGKRNEFGSAYGLQQLPARKFPLAEGTEAFNGTINTHLAVGADFRGANQSTFAQSGNTNTFETEEGNLYADLQVVPERLRLYADVRVAPGGAQTREIFALLSHLPGKFYVKAGRFFAPYGWRLLDDEAFIRASTGFTFQSPDDGVEIGWEPGNWSTSLAVTNGNGGATDDNTNKRVSLVSGWTQPRFRLGGSFASNKQGDVSSLLGGLLAGLKLGNRLVALGELDVGRDEDDMTGATNRRVTGFGEADLLVGKGMNLKTAFDYQDPDTSHSGDEVNRVTLGAEYFVTQYLQLRLLWRRTDRPPEVRGVFFEDDREALLELHLFL